MRRSRITSAPLQQMHRKLLQEGIQAPPSWPAQFPPLTTCRIQAETSPCTKFIHTLPSIVCRQEQMAPQTMTTQSSSSQPLHQPCICNCLAASSTAGQAPFRLAGLAHKTYPQQYLPVASGSVFPTLSALQSGAQGPVRKWWRSWQQQGYQRPGPVHECPALTGPAGSSSGQHRPGHRVWQVRAPGHQLLQAHLLGHRCTPSSRYGLTACGRKANSPWMSLALILWVASVQLLIRATKDLVCCTECLLSLGQWLWQLAKEQTPSLPRFRGVAGPSRTYRSWRQMHPGPPP